MSGEVKHYGDKSRQPTWEFRDREYIRYVIKWDISQQGAMFTNIPQLTLSIFTLTVTHGTADAGQFSWVCTFDDTHLCLTINVSLVTVACDTAVA